MATNLGTAYVTIMPSTQGIEAELKKSLGGAAAPAGTTAGGLIGKNLLGKLAGVVTVGAVTKIFKNILDAGGALQQSFGGLDTIYEDASKAAKQYAREAQKAGISANDYAEQAVSFGAALKMAFGGDVVAAADAANTAILDMADNSAKMGTDIASIQNAYQGFAKQNYTMLDNLKLGYGGTKTEMERLLADAEKLTGIKYDIGNLGDVYNAIHVIQEDLGLTGVAASEASETFTGSFGAMRAAAQNLMADLALGNDITPSLQALAEAVKNFLVNNLFPMIGNILKGVPALIGNSLLSAVEESPEFFASATETLKKWADMLTNSDIDLTAMSQGVGQKIVQAFRDIDWSEFGQALLEMLAASAQMQAPAVFEIFKGIGEGILQTIKNDFQRRIEAGHYIIQNIVEGIVGAGANIRESLMQIVTDAIQSWKNRQAEWLESGRALIQEIVNGIRNKASEIWESIKSGVQSAWEQLRWFASNFNSIGAAIVNGIIEGINGAGAGIRNTLLGWAEDAWASVKNFFGISSPSKLFRDSVGKWIPLGIAEGISDEADSVTASLDKMASDAVTDADLSFSMNSDISGIGNTGNTGGNYAPININIYPSEGMDIRRLAELVEERLAEAQQQQQAIWGMT